MGMISLARTVLLVAVFMLSPAICVAQASPDDKASVRALIVTLASEAEQGKDKFARRPLEAKKMIGRFYASVGHTPVWAGDGFQQARHAIDVLGNADEHGLNPDHYQIDHPLGKGAIFTAEQLARFEVELTGAVLQFLADLHVGRITPDFTKLPDGAKPSNFDPSEHLRMALREKRLAQAIDEAQPRIPLYARVKETLAHYRKLERKHRHLPPLPPAPPGIKLRPGMYYAGVPQLRERLELIGDLPTVTGREQGNLYTSEIADGIRRFQLRHGLEEDGIPGAATLAALSVPLSKRVMQLELTLERLRWIPPLRPGPLIVVNVPAFRLWAFDTSGRKEQEPLEMRVIVGTAARTPTPLFIGQMQYLEFNPYWNVPRSIERAEIIPKLRRDPDYLRKNDMEIVSMRGQPPAHEAAGQLAALRSGAARVRQRPGARNVLGAVKFAMPNPMNIYLHSTSTKELFSKTRRDLSHGCIRVERPADLALFVLADQAPWDRGSVLAALEPGPSRTVLLNAPVPVILSYATAVTDRSGRALFAEDIYKRDQKLAKSLKLE